MNNYIDLLRNILKNFDNNEFDNVIKKILSTLFDEYYMNRNKYIWCVDNLYKEYDESRYNFIKKKYGIIKNEILIFRFNRYSKKSYIIKLLKENFRVVIDENETYESIANNISKKDNIENYKKYIDNMFIEKEIEHDMIKVCKKEIDKKFLKKVDNDFMKNSNCLRCLCEENYCRNHDKL